MAVGRGGEYEKKNECVKIKLKMDHTRTQEKKKDYAHSAVSNMSQTKKHDWPH